MIGCLNSGIGCALSVFYVNKGETHMKWETGLTAVTINKNKFDIYGLITIIAMVAMPAAAAINFGYAAYNMVNIQTSLLGLSVFAGIATGIGFETIGILAGHRAVAFYGNNDNRWIIAAFALIAYVVIGMFELWEIPLARFVPLLSSFVYLLAGLQHDAEAENIQKEIDNEFKVQQQVKRAAFNLEQEAKDREAERRQKFVDVQLKHEAKLARISQKVSLGKLATPTTRAGRKGGSANVAAKFYECACGKVYDNSRAYNGHKRHCTLKDAVKISQNGEK